MDEKDANSTGAEHDSDSSKSTQSPALPATPSQYGLSTPPASFTQQPTWSFDVTAAQVNDTKGKGKRTASDFEPSVQDVPFGPTHPQHVDGISGRKRSRLTASTSTSAEASLSLKAKLVPFNILEAILGNDNILLRFVLQLHLDNFLDLYSISKAFHWKVNARYTTYMSNYTKYNAPTAYFYYPWKLYPQLLISDPTLRPDEDRQHLPRNIPSLRWVQLVMHRHNIIHGTLTLLALEGHRFPAAIVATLMKFWLMVEMPFNIQRRALAVNRRIWSDGDLFLIHMFETKLHMRFSHPMAGHGECSLTPLLLMQKSLSHLYRCLNGESLTTYDDLIAIIVTSYPRETLRENDRFQMLDDEAVVGVLEEDFGILSKEGWKPEGAPLVPAMEILKREAVRRRLHMQQHLIDFVTYGYVDPQTGMNIPLPLLKESTEFGVQDKIVVPEKALGMYKERIKGFEKVWGKEVWDLYYMDIPRVAGPTLEVTEGWVVEEDPDAERKIAWVMEKGKGKAEE